MLALITAALVVAKAENTARAYSDVLIRSLLTGLLVASAVLGLASLYKVIRAANGPSWLDTKVSDSQVTLKGERPAGGQRTLLRARAAAHDLGWGQRLLSVAALLFVALVACTWAIPTNATWP